MRKNTVLALAAAGVIVGVAKIASAQALGIVSLFTTHDDFAGNPSTGWSGWNSTAANGEQLSFNGPDLDGSTLNGLGNYDNTGGGTTPVNGTSPGGSLTIQDYQGGYDTVTTPNEATNSDFVHALYGAHGAGILAIDFNSPLGGTTFPTAPSGPAGSPYFLIGFLIYSNNLPFASGWVNAPAGYTATNPDPGAFGDAPGAYVVNHGTYWTGYIPYSGVLPPSDYSNLEFGIIVNSGDSNGGATPGTWPYPVNVTIDDVQVLQGEELPMTWALNGGGSWATAANWTGISAVPNAQGAAPYLGQTTPAATVTMDEVPGAPNWVVGSMSIDNASGYTFNIRTKNTFSANGGLILDNGAIPAQIMDNGGTHIFNIPIQLNSLVDDLTVANNGDGMVFNNTISGTGGLQILGAGTVTLSGSNTYSGATNINGGNLVVTAAGGLPRGTSLSVGSASARSTLKFSPGLGTLALSNFVVANPANVTVDIANETLQVNYAAAGNPSPLGNLEFALADSAITSSDLPSGYAIGYADNGSSLLIARTLIGDTNLDGTVNLTDLLTLLNNYGQTGAGWSQGDFNYDQTVNLTDLLGLLNNYGMTASSSAFNSTQVVPEPATIALIALVAAGILIRRRVCM